jgi:signal transduction histidine kinase
MAMPRKTGLLGKFTRAFWLQVGLITIAAILGVFLAKLMIEERLVKNAILEEADYFWKHYLGDDKFSLPDTMNLTGYLDANLLPPLIQDSLPTEPGFYEFSDLSNRLVLYISRQQQETLYLIYYRGQVDALVLYYGLFPLLVVLTILYLTLWLAYRFSRRTLSPLTRLTNQINEIDLRKEDLSLTLEDPGLQSDDEIQVLSDALSHLGERLNAFTTRERNFTRNASHEFRTPLTVLNIAADMMLIENNLPAKSQKSLLKIKRAVYDMESLTEVFLMLAREDAGSMTQREVDVNQVVRDQIERSEFLKDSKDVEIKLHQKSQLRVHSSETVIAVLLGNLIRNAILYTEQGEVRIDIEEDQLTIIDSGPGIPQSSIDSIFEPFQRASNENASGYGIGLTIVKRLCDRFHWDIQVSSASQQGTSFKLRFNPT